MKEKIIAGALAALLALAFAGCGEVEGGTDTESSSESVSSSSEADSSENSSSEDSGVPTGDSTPDTESRSDVVQVTVNTYTADQAPELAEVVKKTIYAAAESYEKYEQVFDPNVLIEAKIRLSLTDEDKQNEVRAQFDDESKKQTVRMNYDLIHGALEGLTLTGDPVGLKIQSLNRTLDDSLVFTLNFDIETTRGMLTFVGNACHVDGKWAAVFEPGEHKTESEIEQAIGGELPDE